MEICRALNLMLLSILKQLLLNVFFLNKKKHDTFFLGFFDILMKYCKCENVENTAF